MNAPLSDSELRAALAPLATRKWPVDRLFSAVRDHEAGLSFRRIAPRLGISESVMCHRLTLLDDAGVIERRRAGWSDEHVALFRELWANGTATSEISDRIGVSVGAVAGMRDRLGLPPRGSPIRRTSGAGWLSREPMVEKPRPTPIPQRHPPPALNRPLVSRPPPSAPVERPAPAPRPAVLFGRVRECCWPLGEPGSRDFRYCDDPTLPGRSYCAAHDDAAFGRKPPHPQEAHP